MGGGLVNWPHGFYVDRAGDVWITDGRGENGKGNTLEAVGTEDVPDGEFCETSNDQRKNQKLICPNFQKDS